MPQLDGDHEEEHGEEAVGDPVSDRQVEIGAGNGDVEVEERGEHVVGGQIREEQTESRGDEQEDGGELLAAKGVR